MIEGQTAHSPAPEIRRWRWWIHLLLIGGYIVPRIVLSLRFPPDRPALSHTTGGLLIVCAIELGAFALVFALACFASQASREQLFLHWRPGWWVVPLGLGYSVAIRLAAGIIVFLIIAVLIGSHAVTPAAAQDFITTKQPDVAKLVDLEAMRHSPAYFWLTLTLVSFVVAGLREEMWRAGTLAGLRALWPRAFQSLGGQIAAVALIALLFGAGHLTLGVIGAVVAGLLGLFLGIIIVLHRSIWPAVIAHGLLDATTFALAPFALEQLRQLH
ncbi:MAG TPA: CPBP family intramembrane glutamic endopeptidase [Chthoniobacterales bacterium]